MMETKLTSTVPSCNDSICRSFSLRTLFTIIIAITLSNTDIYASKLWEYDADRNFSSEELYMMDNCNWTGDCSKMKAFEVISNPVHIPVLRDHSASNCNYFRVFFPGCQNSAPNDDSPDKNFCRKVMAQPYPQPQFPFGTDVWVAFSVFIPNNFYQPTDGGGLIYQFHGHPDDLGQCDNWRSSPLSISMVNGKWTVEIHYEPEKCSLLSSPPGIWEEIANINKGAWTHFALKVRFDYSGGGLCQIWIKDPSYPSGTMVFNYHGPIGYNDDKAPYNYVSFGFYNLNWGNSNWENEDITLYFDRLLYGDNNESLSSMMYAGNIYDDARDNDCRINDNSPNILPIIYDLLLIR